MRKSSDSIFGQRHHNGNEDNLSEREDKTDPNAETAWAVRFVNLYLGLSCKGFKSAAPKAWTIAIRRTGFKPSCWVQ